MVKKMYYLSALLLWAVATTGWAQTESATITISPDVVNVGAIPEGGASTIDGELLIAYENVDANFSIQHCDAEGNEIDEAPNWVDLWVYDEVLYYSVNENYTTETRTAYFKVYAPLGSDNVYSNLVTITQAARGVPSITITPDVVNVGAIPEGGASTIDGQIPFTYENLVINSSYNFYIEYFDAEGNEIERPDWIGLGVNNAWDEENSTFDNDKYVVNYWVSENYVTEARTAYFKVCAPLGNGIDYVYSNLLTITQEARGVPSITITPDAVNVEAIPESGYTTIDGELPIAYENVDANFNIQYCDAEGNEIEQPDWFYITTYYAWDEENSTYDYDKYVVEYTVEENYITEARTAYFKVYAPLGDDYVYSNLVTITQTARGVPSITITPDAVNVGAIPESGYSTIEGELPVTHENVDANFYIQYCDAEGNEIEQPDWFYITTDYAWDEENSTYDYDKYVVEYTVEANSTPEPRTAYFKVYAPLGDDYVYSNLVTINQIALGTAMLPFEWAGGASADFKELNGVTTEGLGKDYAAAHAPYLIKFDSDGDYIQVKTDSRPGKVTIGVKMVGGSNSSTIYVQSSSDGANFYNVEYLDISGVQNSTMTLETTNDFDELDRYVRLYFSKGSNVGIGAITITKYAETVTVKIKDGFKATTFSCDKAIDFTNVEGITAYIITDVNGTTQQVTKVPAYHGVYIEGASGEHQIPIITDEEAAEAESDFANSKLEATEQPTGSVLEYVSDDDVTYYIYGKQKGKEAFFRVPTSDYTLSVGNKAVLKIETAANGAKEMIEVNGGVTGISSIDNEQLNGENYYTVDGKLIKGQPTKRGIYIVNGRKVVVK